MKRIAYLPIASVVALAEIQTLRVDVDSSANSIRVQTGELAKILDFQVSSGFVTHPQLSVRYAPPSESIQLKAGSVVVGPATVLLASDGYQISGTKPLAIAVLDLSSPTKLTGTNAVHVTIETSTDSGTWSDFLSFTITNAPSTLLLRAKILP
jgi:hypothetical protein